MKKKTSYLLINSVEIFLKEEWNKSSFQIKKKKARQKLNLSTAICCMRQETLKSREDDKCKDNSK